MPHDSRTYLSNGSSPPATTATHSAAAHSTAVSQPPSAAMDVDADAAAPGVASSRVAAARQRTGSSNSASSGLTCLICGYVAPHSKGLRRHQRRNQRCRAMQRSVTLPNTCPYCRCFFDHHSHLTQHIRLKHPDEVMPDGTMGQAAAADPGGSAAKSAARAGGQAWRAIDCQLCAMSFPNDGT